jgi:hypothetical protein
MFIVLVIIAILLFLILIAIEPEALQAIGACIGLIVGLVVLIVGGVFLFSYLSELRGARQSDANEIAISADVNRAVGEDVQAALEAAAADPSPGWVVVNSNGNTARGPWEHYQSQPDIAPDTDRAVADAMDAANDAANYAEAASKSSDAANPLGQFDTPADRPRNPEAARESADRND